MMTEILRELMPIKKTNEITSEQVLSWAKRAQKAILEAAKVSKELKTVKRTDKQDNGPNNAKISRKIPQSKCRHCSTLYKPHRSPMYSTNCMGCGSANHFELVCCTQAERFQDILA